MPVRRVAGRTGMVPMPYCKEHAVTFVARRILAPRDQEPLRATVLEGKVVGGVGLSINAEHATCSLGYSIAKTHWGKGLTIEVARAVTDRGLRKHGLAKVYADAIARNAESPRVTEKLDMTREGVMRSRRMLRDERVGDVYYGLLRREW